MAVEKVTLQQITRELNGLEQQARRERLEEKTINVAKEALDQYVNDQLSGFERFHFIVWKFLPFLYSGEKKAKFATIQQLFKRMDDITTIKPTLSEVFEKSDRRLGESVLDRLGGSVEMLVKVIPHVDERGYFHKPQTRDEFDQDRFGKLDGIFLGRRDELEAACLIALQNWQRPVSAQGVAKGDFPKGEFKTENFEARLAFILLRGLESKNLTDLFNEDIPGLLKEFPEKQNVVEKTIRPLLRRIRGEITVKASTEGNFPWLAWLLKEGRVKT